ncbi:MAG: Na/Pi symporter [Flammeovirgaceae bacterium]|nr:Na/Pi symporter [Flammeovirgaceae bacterium]
MIAERTIHKIRPNFYMIAKRVLVVSGVLFLFLLSIDLMVQAFNMLGNDFAKGIINATQNPFVGLFIGLLSTAIIQSSSTTTTMVVAIVAAGTISFESALPIIMGANIGTTITSSIVALGHITEKTEFRKAISAAVIHDFFNFFAVLIILPLEYFTGFFSSLCKSIAGFLSIFGIQDNHLKFVPLQSFSNYLSGFFTHSPYLLLALAVILIALSLKSITELLKAILIGDARKKLNSFVFGNSIKSLGMGTIFTAALQSSSVTTSIMVPLVATQKIKLKQALPFIMGANVGTTITALIAAISKSEAAISIAIAHFLFNFIGVLILLPIPLFRNLLIWCAQQLGLATTKNRLIGFMYIMLTFFIIPFFLIFMTSKPGKTIQMHKNEEISIPIHSEK